MIALVYFIYMYRLGREDMPAAATRRK